jgi:hypothetical protein
MMSKRSAEELRRRRWGMRFLAKGIAVSRDMSVLNEGWVATCGDRSLSSIVPLSGGFVDAFGEINRSNNLDLNA